MKLIARSKYATIGALTGLAAVLLINPAPTALAVGNGLVLGALLGAALRSAFGRTS